MSLNKNALIRYRALDRCFRNSGREYTIDCLLEAVNRRLCYLNPDADGIQRRQLYEDIRFMQSEEGWSIELEKYRRGRKVVYRYVDPHFSIDNNPFTKEQETILQSALELLSRFEGLPQFDWVNELRRELNLGLKMPPGATEIIAYEQNRYLTGLEHLQPLFMAIYNKQVLAVKYKPFVLSEAYTQVCHPNYLKQYNRRWFLFAYNETYEGLTVYALDRIIDFQPVAVEYIENDQYEFDEYFEDFIGVSKADEPLIQLQLQFSKARAPYVLTKPLHGSQKVLAHDEEGLCIQLEVIPNVELEMLLLSFGEEVKVLAPESFAQRLSGRLSKAAGQYGC